MQGAKIYSHESDKFTAHVCTCLNFERHDHFHIYRIKILNLKKKTHLPKWLENYNCSSDAARSICCPHAKKDGRTDRQRNRSINRSHITYPVWITCPCHLGQTPLWILPLNACTALSLPQTPPGQLCLKL